MSDASLAKHLLHRLSNSLGAVTNNLYLFEDNGIEPVRESVLLIKSELVLLRQLVNQEVLEGSPRDLERVLGMKNIELTITFQTITHSLIAITLIFAECAHGGRAQISTRRGGGLLKYSKPFPQQFHEEVKRSALAPYLGEVNFLTSSSCSFTTS